MGRMCYGRARQAKEGARTVANRTGRARWRLEKVRVLTYVRAMRRVRKSKSETATPDCGGG